MKLNPPWLLQCSLGKKYREHQSQAPKNSDQICSRKGGGMSDLASTDGMIKICKGTHEKSTTRLPISIGSNGSENHEGASE